MMRPDPLMERLGAADPPLSTTPGPDTVEAVLRQVLSAGASSAPVDDELAARVPSRGSVCGRRFVLGLRSNGPPQRRFARWAMIGVAAATAAVALLVVGTTGRGPTSAFAGWTPDPTQPAAGQLQAAKSACASDRSLASLTPTVIDVRGPFSALLYVRASGPTICVVGPGLTTIVGPGGTKYKAFIVKLRAARMVIAPDTISVRGALLVFPTPTAEFGMVAGQVGRGVTAVTLTLQNGSKVEATTERGWFAAWWPSSQHVESADLTTATGSTTKPLSPPTLCVHPRAGRTLPLNPTAPTAPTAC
jgi:hypothetical protein